MYAITIIKNHHLPLCDNCHNLAFLRHFLQNHWRAQWLIPKLDLRKFLQKRVSTKISLEFKLDR